MNNPFILDLRDGHDFKALYNGGHSSAKENRDDVIVQSRWSRGKIYINSIFKVDIGYVPFFQILALVSYI